MKEEMLEMIESLYVMLKEARFENDDGKTFHPTRRALENRVYSIDRLVRKLPD